MLSLIKMMPNRAEYSAMDEEARNLLFIAMNDHCTAHDLPRVDAEYHPAERAAIMAAYNSYIMDLICEFDLTIDYNGI